MNLWTSNTKTRICEDCPNYDTRDGCLISGIPDAEATLTFVLEKPQEEAARYKQPLRDRDGGVFRHVLSQAQQSCGQRPPYQVAYAVGAPSKKAPKKAVVDVCSTYVEQKLIWHRNRYDITHPGCEKLHVIVTMGATASRVFLPNMESLNKSRGQAHPITLGGKNFIVVPVIGISQINVQPGLVPALVQDIAYALQLSLRREVQDANNIDALTAHYPIPRSEAELLAVTEEILAYHDPAKQADPDAWPIAVDTETNTLHAWKEDAEVLMVSIAWDDQRSTAICLHHPEAPYSKEVARQCLARILASPKPKIFHNLKFDWAMLALREGFEVNNIWWDTLLAEHYLCEDKSGGYSLDALTQTYCKEYAGYKEKIQEALVDKVKAQLLDGITQTEPDVTQSYLLSPFYPDCAYSPACEQAAADGSLDDDKLAELFLLEKEYIDAHVADDAKGKGRARNKVRQRCKKWGIAVPDTITQRNYAKELDAQGFAGIPFDVLLTYAATDTDVTRIACKKQLRAAHQEGTLSTLKTLMRELFIKGSLAVSRMEYDGVRADREYVQTITAEIAEMRDNMLTKLRNIVCDAELNPDSDQQLSRVVTSVLQFPTEEIDLTDTELASVKKGWIEAMAEQYSGEPRGEFMKTLYLYRACARALTFLVSFHELSEADGRIHPTFRLHGTKTGRLACRNPNLQNIPAWMVDHYGHPGWNIKRSFAVGGDLENSDRCFWQMDISQAEIRVLCAYSHDPELIDAVRGGLDTHSFITAKVFGMTYEEVAKGKDVDPDIAHKRTACKRVVFGTIYGAGKYKIAEQIYGSLSRDDFEKQQQVDFAGGVMDTLFSRFPKISQYVEDTQRTVSTKGYVESFFGRRRRFPLRAASDSHRFKAQREAVNFRIQSAASDLVLSQLIELSENLHKIDASMLITVHDSMGGEIPLNRVKEMQDLFDYYIVQRVAEKFPWLPVPFAYDLEVGPTYGEAVDYVLATTPSKDFTEKQKKKYADLSERQKHFYAKLQEAL